MTAIDIRPNDIADRALTVVADPAMPTIDHHAARAAVRDLLAALGQDTDHPELAETPRRVVAAFEELLAPAPFRLTTFANDEGYDELVLVRDIPVQSLCAHHLLPFTGVAHVAYPTNASSDCPSWRGPSRCSPAASRCKSASPATSAPGSTRTSDPKASAWSSKPSTSA